MILKLVGTFIRIMISVVLINYCGCESNTQTINNPPVIQNITADPDTINIGDSTSLFCDAVDDEGLSYFWSSLIGVFPDGNNSKNVIWQGPEISGIYSIYINVSDGYSEAIDSVFVTVLKMPSNPTPVNKADVSPGDQMLSWEFKNLTTANYSFDVYFGDSANPPIVSEDQTDKSYLTQQLSSNRTYFWKIVTKENNEIYPGPLWSFKTLDGVFELGNSGTMMEMMWIPAGSFRMGAPGTAGAGDDESPIHEVVFADGFWMGKFEVTQSQWKAVNGSKSFAFPGPNRPADNVSWNDAKSFINILNESEDGQPWRLPSEAEWEYSARAGHYNTRFWYGNDFSYSETKKHSWISTNSDSRSHDVGTATGGIPNPWGLWDMGGNVWEWCEDWYHWGYIGAPNDGSAWVDPPGSQRIIRGGAWYFDGRRCLPNLRSLYIPGGRTATFGFRLVREQ